MMYSTETDIRKILQKIEFMADRELDKYHNVFPDYDYYGREYGGVSALYDIRVELAECSRRPMMINTEDINNYNQRLTELNMFKGFARKLKRNCCNVPDTLNDTKRRRDLLKRIMDFADYVIIELDRIDLPKNNV